MPCINAIELPPLKEDATLRDEARGHDGDEGGDGAFGHRDRRLRMSSGDRIDRMLIERARQSKLFVLSVPNNNAVAEKVSDSEG